MKINVGSKNLTKTQAVAEVIKNFELFGNARIESVDVGVETYGHPKNLQEVIDGAINRARQAFKSCEYSFGIEGGLMEVPRSKTGFMEVAACAVYDGKEFHLGLSPAFEWPRIVIDGILNKKLDASQALKEAGLTQHQKIGEAEGGIYLLTNGQIDRKEYNKSAVLMAMVHLLNPEHY